jgi:hypothetical protein
MPRLERRQQRTWRNRDERPLFATDCLRPARVVLDTRLPAESVQRPLQFILENPHVEVGTLGYSPTCDVEIAERMTEFPIRISGAQFDDWATSKNKQTKLRRSEVFGKRGSGRFARDSRSRSPSG